MIIALLIGIAGCLYLLERLFPARRLPEVEGWWKRVALVNLAQLGVVLLAGVSWERWLQAFSLLSLSERLGIVAQAAVAYVVSTFVYYWWHRYRHESAFFWRLCHQLHHSPSRIELVTSFYKHPVEILLNSLISAALVYTVLGCSVEAGGVYTFLIAVAEYFYHLNIRTPRWIGYFIQRPESHRVHHRFRHHTQNFADLPIWDLLFGTFCNPRRDPERSGFEPWREARFQDMLLFRDLHAADASTRPAATLLPTCIGCRKRSACQLTASQSLELPRPTPLSPLPAQPGSYNP